MKRIGTLMKHGLRLLRFYRVFSTSRSFEGLTPVGIKSLNRMGLHRWRVRTAARLTAWRRSRLERGVPEELRSEFAQNGYVVIHDVLPESEFAALREAIEGRAWPAREMFQGDTLTRRAAVNRTMLERVPGLSRLLGEGWLQSLLNYVSGFRVAPLLYVQSITRREGAHPDPQTHLHSDSFHPSMKAWYFLGDVRPDEGAFTYVPGSHRATPERLRWEHAKALTLPESGDRMTRRGSFRVEPEELAGLGLPQAKELACPANTLVIADTYGFHARGPSKPDLNRLEIWFYCRRNPFLPWLGGDLFSLPALAPRRMEWLWDLRDRYPRLLKQPWRKAGMQRFRASSGGES